MAKRARFNTRVSAKHTDIKTTEGSLENNQRSPVDLNFLLLFSPLSFVLSSWLAASRLLLVLGGYLQATWASCTSASA